MAGYPLAKLDYPAGYPANRILGKNMRCQEDLLSYLGLVEQSFLVVEAGELLVHRVNQVDLTPGEPDCYRGWGRGLLGVQLVQCYCDTAGTVRQLI